MHIKWLAILRSPGSGNALDIKIIKRRGDVVDEGMLVDASTGASWPIRDGVVDFVNDAEDYASSFGEQWNIYRRTQIDSFSGQRSSEDLFAKYTGWEFETAKSYLDLGCGAGRFTDIVLKKGAGTVICVDLSTAVFACQKNLSEIGYDERQFLVIRASIFDLPFAPAIFERVFSIGVLQHTPSAKRFVNACANSIKSHGELAIWAYEKTFKAYMRYKYPLRWITKSWRHGSKVRLATLLVNIFMPIFYFASSALRRLSVPMAELFEKFAPFAFRYDDSYKYAFELSVLDTIDNLTPVYDTPITERELTELLLNNGAKSVKRMKVGGLGIVSRF